jgi:hypothetical protein
MQAKQGRNMKKTNAVVSGLITLALAGSSYGAWLGDGAVQAPVKRVIAKGNSSTIIDIEIPGVVAEARDVGGAVFHVISIPGDVPATLEVGKPDVPKVSLLLGIPDGAKVAVSLTVLESRVFDNINCYPNQPPLRNGELRPFTIDRACYESNSSYPAGDAQLMNTGIWGSLSVANIQAYPVHYNPARKQLTVYSHFRIIVRFTGADYVHKVIKPWMAALYARWLDNFRQLDVAVAETDDPGVKYLVVSHENWSDNPMLESLVQWHLQQGVETRVIHKSGWTAPEIRDSIRAEYGRHAPSELRWVLLVGEFAEIPMRAMGGVGYSDYYYSDLSPDAPDNYPEIGLARLSPATATDLENQIHKILTYERNPPTGNWLTRYGLIAADSSVQSAMRIIYNQPRSYYRYDFDTLDWQYHGNDSIAAMFNRGAGAVAYRGHGDWDQWYSNGPNGSWTVNDVNNLTNGDLTPMVFNFASLCGDIMNPTCLSEAWLRKYPGGGVGSFAATQASYTYPNRGMCSTAVACLCDTGRISVPGVRDYILPVFDVGGIQCNVDAYVAKYWPGSPYPDNIYMYLNLGDPAMEIWSGGEPHAPTVAYPPTVPLGPYPFLVTVQVDGRGVGGALVCAWKDSEFYAFGRTDENGNAYLQTNAQTPGDFRVTVSRGHAATSPHTPILPFQGTCTAVRLNHDIGVLALIPPTETVEVGTAITPSCTLFNFGTSAETYGVRFRVGDFYSDEVVVAGHLSGTSYAVSFLSWVGSETGMCVQKCSVMISDENPTNDWKMDTIWLVRRVGVTDPEQNPLPANGLLLSAEPNPFGDKVVLRLPLTVCGSRPEVRIYDVSGALVRHFAVPYSALLARQRVVWDGTDGQGRRLPSGVYLARAEFDNRKTLTRQLLLLR